MLRPKRSRGFYAIIALCVVVACIIAIRHLASRSNEPPENGANLKCSKLDPEATVQTTDTESDQPSESGADLTWSKLDPEATVEIADTNETRRQGLMFRNSLAADHGMYFTYPANHRTHFWMRNTTLPLSIAFIRDDGVIVDVRDMVPLDETAVGPNVQYRDALEMNQGWFKRNGIKVGDRAELKGGRVSFWRRSL
ncbi:MAG: DUF192 domain-containing protein [Verrucomicrobia bacterium]|nr:DUF192 domain-containing protein [Verrucomicrobiota bacterium]